MKLNKTLGGCLYQLFGPNGSDQVVSVLEKRQMDVFRELERHGVVRIVSTRQSKARRVQRNPQQDLMTTINLIPYD